ncbi:type 4 pilus major pilin [Burkholderia sp. MR1-5-21]
MSKLPSIHDKDYYRRIARRRKQSGELSMIEAAAVMAGAALLALVVYQGRGYVMDRIHAHQFKSEAQLFVAGIQDATQADTDFSAETLTTLAQNHAFDSAGSRINVAGGTLTGLFGGAVTAAPSTVTTANDAIALTYPVPATVCALTAGAIAGAYSMVKINTTTVASPTVTFSDTAAGTACASAGATATMVMYTTHGK